MAGLVTSPLSANEIERLRRARRDVNEALLLTSKSNDCGFDCRAHQAALEAYAAYIDAALHHFAGERKPE